jgi:hypothetical protein
VAFIEKDIIRPMRCLRSGRARRAISIAFLVCLLGLDLGCGRVRRMFGREYEYEEDVTLSVDGSAVIDVNASLASLVVLRGLPLDVNPRVKFAPDRIRAAFEAVGCSVTRVSSSPWIREGRRFVQIRMDLPDIRKAADCGVLGWSTYSFTEQDGLLAYRQIVGMPAGRDAAGIKWKGDEIVGFKMHLPSKIASHNVRDLETREPLPPERGNILTWEQRLADRRIGTPLVLEFTMERDSILYRTLWLFAGALAAALLVMGGLIAWTVRRGRRAAQLKAK